MRISLSIQFAQFNGTKMIKGEIGIGWWRGKYTPRRDGGWVCARSWVYVCINPQNSFSVGVLLGQETNDRKGCVV
jgi:hypothetical protein